MSHFSDLSTEIVNLLKTVQQEGQFAFVDVLPIPTLQFNGFPSATVTPADNLSEYANIVENFRTYVFDIDIFYFVGQQPDNGGYTSAFAIMLILVDSVLDALDNSNTLNDKADIIRPVPSVWSTVQTSGGTALTARITIQCAVTVAQNNG